MAQKVFVTLALNSETDRDILRWLDRQDNKSAAIRAAIRATITSGGVTIGDVYQAVKALERKVAAGVIVTASDDNYTDEPPEAAAALDALANL